MNNHPADELGHDLLVTQNLFGVRLLFEVATNLIDEVEKRQRIRKLSYRDARRQAIEFWGIYPEQRDAWVHFLNHVFSRRRLYNKKEINQPSPPIEVYEDDMR